MISQIPKASEPSPIPGPPHLPLDIYIEVLGHLKTSLVADRKTLRALALCCRDLRDASQRILFSSMSYGHPATATDSNRLFHILKIHSKFLSIIKESPNRLALYVHQYSQHRLALDWRLRSTSKALKLAYRNHHVELWFLLERALPLMVNLKSLYFAPLIYHPSAPLLLRNCFRLQLQSLTWRGLGSEDELYTRILPFQHELLHLDINSESHSDRLPLPDRLCTGLVSIACSLEELARVSASRAIIALHVANSTWIIARTPREDLMSASERERCITALKRIQYLRLRALPPFQKFTGGIMLHKVSVLQLGVWQIEDMTLLKQFPNLHSLRLWGYFTSRVNASTTHNTAAHAFAQCPMLHGILIVTNVANSPFALRFSPRSGGGIEAEETSIDYDVDTEWWKMIV